MAEGSRFIPVNEEQIINLDKSNFQLVNNMKFGSKGVLEITGVVVKEREENQKLIKTVEVRKVTQPGSRRLV